MSDSATQGFTPDGDPLVSDDQYNATWQILDSVIEALDPSCSACAAALWAVVTQYRGDNFAGVEREHAAFLAHLAAAHP